jgi:hypothetical protein
MLTRNGRLSDAEPLSAARLVGFPSSVANC